jgi:PAS domain S-box-containing protein
MPGSHDGSVGWEQLFWRVFERSTTAMTLTDEHNVIAAINEAACEWLGAPREEIIGTRGARFLTPQEQAALAAERRELWETGELVMQRTVIRPDGSVIRIQSASRTVEIGGRRIALSVWLAVEFEDEAARAAQLGELTPREREVLALVALGHTSAQIAEQLVISSETVRTHVQHAMAKTGARTRAQLVAMVLTDRHIEGGG